MRGEQGWHTYTLRKTRPVRPFARFDADALGQWFTRLMRAAGKAWRQGRTLLRQRGNGDDARPPERAEALGKP